MADHSLTVIAPRGVARSVGPGGLLEAWRTDIRERVLAGESARPGGNGTV